MARREQLVLAVAAATPHGPDRVDDETRRQAAGRRRLGVARIAAAEPAALVENGRAPGAMNRAVDPAAAQQRAVGGVDDRVGGESGDVALLEPDAIARGQIVSLVEPNSAHYSRGRRFDTAQPIKRLAIGVIWLNRAKSVAPAALVETTRAGPVPDRKTSEPRAQAARLWCHCAHQRRTGPRLHRCPPIQPSGLTRSRQIHPKRFRTLAGSAPARHARRGSGPRAKIGSGARPT